MVMHARKLPRLNDGYYDRNQAHPYENTSKYSKSNYGERYNDKVQDSPSNGSNCGRSESPDSRYSPRYQGKSSYTQRLKEKERERQEKGSNRSPCTRDRGSRNSSGSSSGAGSKEHQQSVSSSGRGTDSSSSSSHRTNHEKSQNEEKEKRIQVGDWSEHTSSSGKKYYYNCKTEVSQWEKPKEWIEWEKQQSAYKSNEANKSKDRSERQPSGGNRSTDRHSSSNSADKMGRSAHHLSSSDPHQSDRHSSSNRSAGSSSVRNAGQPQRTSSRSGSTGSVSGGSHMHFKGDLQQQAGGDGVAKVDLGHGIKNERHHDGHHMAPHSRKSSDDSQMQDMDISPGSSIGTPLSSHAESNSLSSQTPLQAHTPVAAADAQQQQQQQQHQQQQQPHRQQQQPTVPPQQQHQQPQPQLLSPSQATLADLPKLISQLAGTRGLPNLSELSPQDALRTIQQALQLTKQVTSLAQTTALSHSPVTLPPLDSLTQKSPSPLPPTSSTHGSGMHHHHHHHHHHQQQQQQHGYPPPVTTAAAAVMALGQQQHHSSSTTNQLPITQMLVDADKMCATDRGRSSPGSDYSTHSSRHGSPSSSISSLHSLSGTATSSLASAVQKPSVPTLTPSLANYYKEELISHVTGWQADHAERQANRYSEEAHTIGSLNCTRVSAELKMARSLVRLAEIQATLQEQRVLEYEKWKACIRNLQDSHASAVRI